MTRLIIIMAITLGFAQSLGAETDEVKLQLECIGQQFSGILDINYTDLPVGRDFYDVDGKMTLSGFTFANGIKKKAKTIRAYIIAADKAAFLARSKIRATDGNFFYALYRFDYTSMRLSLIIQTLDLDSYKTRTIDYQDPLIYNCARVKQP